jgi:hypothetical protein
MSLSEQDERSPDQILAGFFLLRFHGASAGAIAKELRFPSVEDMREQLSGWDMPGWVVGRETDSGKKGVHEKGTPRLRGFSPGKDLPPAGNATELFRERLEALLKSAELLKHMDEGLHGRHFGSPAASSYCLCSRS